MAGDDFLRIDGSRSRYALLLAAALAFVVAALTLSSSMRPAASVAGTSVETFVGWAGIAFFGACALVLARQLFDPRPRIVIDEAGAFDRTLGVGVIPWAEIRDAQLCHIGGQPFIRLELRKEEAWLARLRPLHRRLAAANRALGFGALNLNLSATRADPVYVLQLVRKRAAAHLEA
jgi:hypothetical protein